MTNQYQEEECPICYDMSCDTAFDCGHPICSCCKPHMLQCYYRCCLSDSSGYYNPIQWCMYNYPELLLDPELDPPMDEDYMASVGEGTEEEYITWYRENCIRKFLRDEGFI